MAKEEKQFQIYLKATRQWVQVTEEFQKEYYRDIDSFRRKQQRHDRCNCPRDKWWFCDMDCENCEFRRADDQLLVEAEMKTDEGTTSFLETISDSTVDVEETLMQADAADALYKVLDCLDSESQQICQLIMEGHSMRESARILGLPWTTYQRRWEKTKSELRFKLEDYM